MTSLLKFSVGRKLGMPGVVESPLAAQTKALRCNQRGPGSWSWDPEDCSKQRKSSAHKLLTFGSLGFTTQECGDRSPVGGIWVMGVEFRTELMLFF